jgi:uncharacterized membrane protein
MKPRATPNSIVDNAPVQNHESISIDSHSEHLPEQILKNVEVMLRHEDRHKQESKTHQRVLDKLGAIFCQPQFLYGQIVFFTVWIVCSNLAERKILPQNFLLFDPDYHALEVASLLTSSGVLVYQTRQGQLSEERSHLMLQLNLITEQKIAKLISLVEELRVDLPNVKNRDDLEAEVMKQAIDPQAILEVLQHNSEHLSPSSTSESQT